MNIFIKHYYPFTKNFFKLMSLHQATQPNSSIRCLCMFTFTCSHLQNTPIGSIRCLPMFTFSCSHTCLRSTWWLHQVFTHVYIYLIHQCYIPGGSIKCLHMFTLICYINVTYLVAPSGVYVCLHLLVPFMLLNWWWFHQVFTYVYINLLPQCYVPGGSIRWICMTVISEASRQSVSASFVYRTSTGQVRPGIVKIGYNKIIK